VSAAAPDPAPPRPPAGASRYGWFVGVVAILVLAYITFNTLHSRGPAAGVATGGRLPPFAVPLLGSNLDGDANVAVRPGKGAGASGHVTACQVSDPRALNLCRTAAGHPVVLAFVSVKQEASLRQLDAMAAASRRFPSVRFIGLFLRGDRGAARRAAADHRWAFALGWDRSGDVASVYGVKALPSVTVADAGRRERSTSYRFLTAAALGRRIRAVERR
jgi:hypothetical protein